jgi:replicative DNA helicase
MSSAKKIEKDDPDYLEKLREAELIIRKQRNGPIGDVKLIFKNEYAKFENVIKHPVIDVPSSYESEETPF